MGLIEINRDISHNQLRLFGGLLFLFGPGAETFIRRYFSLLSLALVVLVVLGFLVLPFVLR